MSEEHDCMAFAESDLDVQQLGLGAAASRYQQMGYAVLGLAEAAKRPHPAYGEGNGQGGVHLATRDPRMVPWLWGKHRAAGIGIATGAPSQLVVVDLDTKRGEDGPASWDGFLNGAAFPHDVIASTPGGGWHVWLAIPAGTDFPGRAGLLPGVDIKASGGYVAAAPTRIWAEPADRPGEHGSGRVLLPYRWVRGCPCSLPRAPQWFLEWISVAVATGTDHGSGDAPPDLAALAATGLPPGQRNVILYRLACSMYRRYGTAPDGMAAVQAAIRPVLDATDKAGFGQVEIARILRSARDFIRQAQERELDAWQSR